MAKVEKRKRQKLQLSRQEALEAQNKNSNERSSQRIKKMFRD